MSKYTQNQILNRFLLVQNSKIIKDIEIRKTVLFRLPTPTFEYYKFKANKILKSLHNTLNLITLLITRRVEILTGLISEIRLKTGNKI